MARYIAVIHGWHVYSKGFTTHELEAGNQLSAEQEASWLRDKREKPFETCAVTILEIRDNEILSRKLSWRERLTGRLEG